jgi:2-polyprenyl-3-methyl-5-hydroxy-6-metoxy-1,4-benzoquinol methylase
MINEDCLICEKKITISKNWNSYNILICKECLFSFIQIKKIVKDEVFSPSEKKFYEKSISGDEKRSNLFIQKIVKNRINSYEKILKRKPLNILEVGCGTAVMSKGYLQNGVEYTGIEYDKNIFNFAKSKSRNIIFGDFLTHNFKKKFDILFASQVVEHIEKPDIFFKKCNMILNKNGILHIDVPNDHSMISYLRKAFKNNEFYGAIRPPYHMRAYSPKSLKKLFIKNNFYNLKIFSKINFDRTYGQLVDDVPLKINLIFRFQQLLGMNSLLVGLAQKKS